MIAVHFPSGAGRAIIAASRESGPVPEKHLTRSGSKPHRQAGFCHVQILGLVRLHPLHGFGRDGQKGNLRRTTSSVFFTSRPPAAMKTQTVASLGSLEGIQTMTSFTRAQAAPADLPTTDPRLYFGAINGLAHALRILTEGNLDQSQLQRAIGKATRAATAMKRMAADTTVEG